MQKKTDETIEHFKDRSYKASLLNSENYDEDCPHIVLEETVQESMSDYYLGVRYTPEVTKYVCVDCRTRILNPIDYKRDMNTGYLTIN